MYIFAFSPNQSETCTSLLISIWNSPAALAKRSRMISGRYVASGCSSDWCSWRDGKKAAVPASAEIQAGISEMQDLRGRAETMLPLVRIDERPNGITAVRRLLTARERSIRELQTMFEQLCETNREMHEKGREHIAALEAYIGQLEARDAEAKAHVLDLEAREAKAGAHIAHLEDKARKAVGDFEALREEIRRLRSWRIVRLGAGIARLGRAIGGWVVGFKAQTPR